jgi:hypothetical protein
MKGRASRAPRFDEDITGISWGCNQRIRDTVAFGHFEVFCPFAMENPEKSPLLRGKSAIC